jgi:hypothetical protein
MSHDEESNVRQSRQLNPYATPGDAVTVENSGKSPLLFVAAMWLGGVILLVLPFLATGTMFVPVMLIGSLIGTAGVVGYVVSRKGWKKARLLSRSTIWTGIGVFFSGVVTNISIVRAVGFLIGLGGVFAWLITRAGELRSRSS